MSGKNPAKDTKPSTVVANDPDDLKGTLKNIGGSRSDDWNNILANQTVQALWLKHSDPATRDRQYSATVAALMGIAPTDELEGMMAVQLIAAHNAAMECYRRCASSQFSCVSTQRARTSRRQLSAFGKMRST